MSQNTHLVDLVVSAFDRNKPLSSILRSGDKNETKRLQVTVALRTSLHFCFKKQKKKNKYKSNKKQ